MPVKVSELGAVTLPLSGSELVHLVQGGVSKKGTAQDIADLASVGAGSGDIRDGIRAWVAPYNVSKDATAAANVSGINQAILDARSHARGAPVLLPQGVLNINAPIVVYPGTRLYGGAPAANGNGTTTSSGTTLFLASGSNCNVIQDSFWATQDGQWDGGEIANLDIDANQANNAAGLSAIAIYQPGKSAVISRVAARNAKRYGVEIKSGSRPASIRNLTAFGNKLGAIYHEGHGGLVIDGLQAEQNDTAVVHLKGGLGAGVTILGPDCKSPFDNAMNFLLLDDFQGSVTVIGGRVLSADDGATAADALVKISGTNGPASVRIIGLHELTHTLTIDDQVNTLTYPRRTGGQTQGVTDLHIGVNTLSLGGLALQAPGVAVGSGPQLLAGAGAPSAAVPNGSMYLRTDGGAGTTVYVRRSGVWSGIH